MAYMALYRKWRPSGFAELVGQEHVSRTLSNAVNAGRVGHAYLFAGPRGTGKTSTAKILAKALNCEKGPTPNPCNECAACQRINAGSSLDVFEIDAASNRGIDEIRDLRETVKFAPAEGRYKVYIIDEVHMLTMEAFNALLKTLEEPPAHVVFILATTEAHKVPATIQSRCQRYDFKRITAKDIQGRLELVADNIGLEYDAEALHLIALKADGGMRDALGLLDQCAALTQGKLTALQAQSFLGLIGREWIENLAEAVGNKNAAEVLAKVSELLQGGKELSQMLSELAMYFRSLLVLKAAGKDEAVDYGSNNPEKLAKYAAAFTESELLRCIRRVHSAMAELKWSPQPRITVEAALLELCQRREMLKEPEDVKADVGSRVDGDRISQLEAKLAQLAAAVRSRPDVPVSAASPVQSPAVAVQNISADSVPNSVANTGVQAPEANALQNELLQVLQQENAAPAAACVKKCAIFSIAEAQVVLGCPTEMVKGLVERIYRKKLESVLQRLLGRQVRLLCRIMEVLPSVPVAEPDLPDIPPPTDEDEGGVDISSLSQKEQKQLKHAAEVFGGDFIEPPEED